MLQVEETIRIDMPVSDVFAAWSSADRLKKWFAPMALQPVQVEMDFREGGLYRIEMDMGVGGVHVTTGRFLKIVPLELIHMTWRCDAWSDPPSHVEVSFVSEAASTVVRVLHTKITSEAAREGQLFGWTSCLSELHIAVSGTNPSERNHE